MSICLSARTPDEVRVMAETVPDLFPQWCCLDAAEDGPAACSCWEPQLSPPPAGVPVAGPGRLRRTSCHDCAYRQGSPEHDGELPIGDRPFLCHEGMPRIVGWTHPDADFSVLAFTDGYDPIRRGWAAWKADGQPASLCAGWAASRTAGHQVNAGPYVPREQPWTS